MTDNRYIKFVANEYRDQRTSIVNPTTTPIASPRRPRLGFFGWIGVIIWALIAAWFLIKGANAETGWVMMECPMSNQPCHPQGTDRREPHVYVGREACLLDIPSIANLAASGTRFYCDKITRNRGE